MWKLTIVDDEGKRTDLPLSRGEYAVGRDEENTVRLTDRNISRKHLVLRRSDEGWMVEDLSSYNGCYVNGVRVSGSQPLQHGDLLQLGDYRLELYDESRLSEQPPAVGDAVTVPAPTGTRLLDRPDRLVVVDGAAAGTEFALEGDRIVIGRAEDVDISINHSSVSRVHAEIVNLGNGHYEIFDRGSSNGIRINGVKSERRVIEDDDEIELGDVRLRFVARGRIFRPGSATLAHSFAAASEEPFAGRLGQRRNAIGMMVAAGALLGILAVVGFVALHSGGTEPDSAAASSGVDRAASIVAEAARLADTGQIDAVYSKLNELPENSSTRESPEVRALAGRWADAMFVQASSETDAVKRGARLAEVAGAKLVDPERRKRAADQLNAMDKGTGTDVSALPVASASAAADPAQDALAGHTPRATDTASKGLAPKSPNSTAAAPTAPPPPEPKDNKTTPPPTSTKPAGGSEAGWDKEATKGKEGEDRARRMLEPRVWSGKATVDEIQMLRAICKHQRDFACASRCSSMLKK